MPSATQRSELVLGLRAIALEAGEAIMRIYATGTEVRTKADASPVTDADEEASRIILAGLGKIAPSIPTVCEETHETGSALPSSPEGFVLVDPLDGTKEFISKNGEFTVNIALIFGGRPVCGVVYAPAIGRLFLGWREDDGEGQAFQERDGQRTPIRVGRPSDEGVVVVASRSHRDPKTDEYLAKIRVKSFTSAGSSLKFCLVATGEADLYPRLGRTMEWDTAAGQSVLEAAGGSVSRLEGGPLLYGKPGFENPFFVARGG